MDNRSIILNETFTNKFDESRFKEFIINFLNLDSNEILSNIEQKASNNIYENSIDYIKDIGKYSDKDRNTIIGSIVKLKKSPEKSRNLQRNFIAQHIRDIGADAAIVAIYSEDNDIWRISFVKLEYEFTIEGLKEKLTPARRYSYLIEPKSKNHTAQQQFKNMLFDYSQKPSVEDIEKVFSVEVVTDEFFKRYKDKYLDLKEYLEKDDQFIKEANRLRIEVNEFSEEFAKKLMGQIAFLYFLQKKGWLGVKIVPQKIDRGELRELYKKQNEEIREIITKVYRPNDNIMKLDSKQLKKLTNEQADMMANVFRYTKYEQEWGQGTKTFIRDLFERSKKDKNFFNDYLEPLFYNALNNKRGANEYFKEFNCKIPFLNGGLFEPIYEYDWENTNLVIPNEFFSNKDENSEGTGVLDFFDLYNFTMNEDEPLEKEVAVDPEMLGKIFENLLEIKERKSKGAFYTPREIVHYMCQDCLIHYLNNKTNIDTASLELLIKYGEFIKDEDIKTNNKDEFKMPKTIVDNLEVIDSALASVAVADPAVGSGAFPLGMLSEIVRARSVITEYIIKTLTEWDKEDKLQERSLYNLKKHAMQRSIFAVDIEASAVDITKLRLWLSLVVDADNKTINTLPNLDYNIMVGNSLIEEFEGIKLFNEELLKEIPKNKRKKKKVSDQISMNIEGNNFEIGIEQEQQILEDIQTLQNGLFNIKDTKEKIEIKKEIEAKEWDLIKYKLSKDGSLLKVNELRKLIKEKRKPYFLWKLEFSKIFKEKGGFDIVIGNPPYIKIQNLDAKQVEILKRVYKSATGKFDIYVLFIENSFNLINTEGIVSFIQPHRFLIADYGKGVRKYLQDSKGLNKFINFGVSQVFDTATTYTGIFFFTKQNEYIEYTNADTSNLNFLKFNKKHYDSLGKEWVFKNGVEESILEKIKSQQIKIMDIFHGIYQGVITVGDDIFILSGGLEGNYFIGYSNELDRNVKIEKEMMKPLLKGENIRRYQVSGSNNFVFYPHELNSKGKTKPIEEDILKTEYPYAYEYISNFKEHLVNKKVKYKTNVKQWYSLHRAREKSIFESRKIITPQLQNYPNFTIDMNSNYPDAGGYSLIKRPEIKDSLKYFLGILNSSTLWFFIKNTSTAFNNNYFYFKSTYLEPFAFPDSVDEEFKNQIVRRVEELQQLYNSKDELLNREKLRLIESEVNEIVYKIYNFTDEEIKVLEEHNIKI